VSVRHRPSAPAQSTHRLVPGAVTLCADCCAGLGSASVQSRGAGRGAETDGVVLQKHRSVSRSTARCGGLSAAVTPSRSRRDLRVELTVSL